MDKNLLNNHNNNANTRTADNKNDCLVNELLNQTEIQRQINVELELKLKAKKTELEEKQKQLDLETKHSKDLEQQINNIFLMLKMEII